MTVESLYKMPFCVQCHEIKIIVTQSALFFCHHMKQNLMSPILLTCIFVHMFSKLEVKQTIPKIEFWKTYFARDGKRGPQFCKAVTVALIIHRMEACLPRLLRAVAPLWCVCLPAALACTKQSHR